MRELRTLSTEDYTSRSGQVDRVVEGKIRHSTRRNRFGMVGTRRLPPSSRVGLGMATSRVRAGFFHTRTRPAGQDPWPGPAPFRVPGFFPGPRPAPAGPHGPRGPRLEIGPNSWPNQKKKNPDNVAKPAYSKKKTQIYFCLHSSLHIQIQA